MPTSPTPATRTTSRCANSPSARASRPRPRASRRSRAADLPGLRESEARAAAGLQRLTNARELLDREEARARERMGELDRRLSQFSADIEREQRLPSDADVALHAPRRRRRRAEGRDQGEASNSAAASTHAWPRRKRRLPTAEKVFAELTTALAALTAQRNSLEANVRTHRDRVARLDQEIANVEAESSKLAQATHGLGDLDALPARTRNRAGNRWRQPKPPRI